MDPFGLAVAVAGLASLGIQLVQGLNEYAGSALDSKGRITFILTDVKLANQVIQSLKAIVSDDAILNGVSAEAKCTGKDVVEQCEKIFQAIYDALPRAKAAELRKRDIALWPFTEPKLKVLRGELDKFKVTLQLFISVATFAAMSPPQTVVKDTLDKHRQEIKDLLRQRRQAEARTARLERDLARHSAVASIVPSPPVLSPPPDSSSDQIHIETVVGNSAETKVMLANGEPYGEGIASDPSRSEVGQSRQQDRPTTPRFSSQDRDCTGSDSGDGSSDVSDGELAMHLLHQEYELCLYRLEKLQRAIEKSLRAMYIPMDYGKTSLLIPDPGLDWKSRETHVRSVVKEGRKAYRCLDRHLLNADAIAFLDKNASNAQEVNSPTVPDPTTTIMNDATPEPGIMVRPSKRRSARRHYQSLRNMASLIGRCFAPRLFVRKTRGPLMSHVDCPENHLEPIPGPMSVGPTPPGLQVHDNAEDEESSSETDLSEDSANDVVKGGSDDELDDLLRRWTTLYTDPIDEAVSEVPEVGNGIDVEKC